MAILTLGRRRFPAGDRGVDVYVVPPMMFCPRIGEESVPRGGNGPSDP